MRRVRMLTEGRRPPSAPNSSKDAQHSDGPESHAGPNNGSGTPEPSNDGANGSHEMQEVLRNELDYLRKSGLIRTLRTVHQRRSGTVLIDGHRVADFASNDYLGLAADPRVARAAMATLQAEGTGAASARLISGHHPIHEALERELAHFCGVEAALLFPSGYMANLGAIQALVEEGDVIYADELNHASLVDAARLSRADVRIFPHRDLDKLAAMLDADRSRYRRALIIVESVYSMDGDLFPLDNLVHIAKRFDAWSYVDDAHGTGVIGTDGKGAPDHFGVTGDIDVTAGSLGKALGTSGAFVTGSAVLIDYLVSRARPFIYTTGAPPALAAATLEALRIATVEPWRREAVHERAAQLRLRLSEAGREPPGRKDGHIIPVVIGDPRLTMQIVLEMRKRGFLVGGVRPPAVPAGTSRLRLSVSAMHPIGLVDSAAAHLIDTLRSAFA